MDIQNLQTHIDTRLDRIEDKLDGHLDRIAKTEADLSWVRGHIKIVTTVAIAIVTGMAGVIYRLLLQ